MRRAPSTQITSASSSFFADIDNTPMILAWEAPAVDNPDDPEVGRALSANRSPSEPPFGGYSLGRRASSSQVALPPSSRVAGLGSPAIPRQASPLAGGRIVATLRCGASKVRRQSRHHEGRQPSERLPHGPATGRKNAYGSGATGSNRLSATMLSIPAPSPHFSPTRPVPEQCATASQKQCRRQPQTLLAFSASSGTPW